MDKIVFLMFAAALFVNVAVYAYFATRDNPEE